MNDVWTQRIYDVWSHFYNAVRRMGIKPGDRVLDVGVGAGSALASWPAQARVTGLGWMTDVSFVRGGRA